MVRSTENTHHESAQNRFLSLAVTMVVGDRPDQQDSFGYHLEDDEAVITVCDGMGGHMGGGKASRAAVGRILDLWETGERPTEVQPRLQEITREADRTVAALTGDDGRPLAAGSTMITLVIRGRDMYWNSVGDSRVYLMRGGEIVQVTQDQNYETVLNEQLRAGEITREAYERELPRGSALVNYLGIGQLSLIDYNAAPIRLEPEDRILMATDGLYRLVGDEEIRTVLDNFRNIEDALAILEQKAKRKAAETRQSRDNMTTAIIRILQEENA